MRKTKLAVNEYYHIYNRGVDKRLIFLDPKDYLKFLYLLYAGNDTKPIFYNKSWWMEKDENNRKLMVDIICFCLMPNHFHLLLKQNCDNGISNFMQKILTGYTMYFNNKYQRTGVLLQGKFKSIHIDRDEYLTHLTRYIHLNPAEIVEPKYKEFELKDLKNTYKFVKNYQWSSYCDYLGNRKFSHILNTELIRSIYKTPRSYEQFVQSWTSKDLDPINNFLFD